MIEAKQYELFFKRHIQKLKISPSGQAIGLCPLHDDHNPSFSCNINDGVWKCHGCGKSGNVYQLAKRLEVDPPCEEKYGQSLTEDSRYDYHDQHGRPYMQVRRYLPKTFRQYRYEGERWVPGLNGNRPILYRLPEVIKSGEVFITEGEKDADTLHAWGFIATTNPSGALKWREEYSEILRGKDIVILGDMDETGKAHVQQVARSLWDKAKTIKIINLPKGKDVTRWKELGGTLEELKRIIEDTPFLSEIPNFSMGADAPGMEPEPIMVRLSDVMPEQVSWLWPQRIARGKLTLIIGDPGLGKSFVSLDIAARISAGYDWPDGVSGKNGSVILLSAEDGVADTIRPRLDALKGDPQNVHALQAIKQNDTERGFYLATDLVHLESAILQTRASLVIIDPLSAYFGGKDTYKDSEVRSLLAPLVTLAERTGVAVVAVMHVTKNSERRAIHRIVGSIGFVGAARIVLGVAKDPDNENRRFLFPVKTNLSALPPTLAFGIQNGILTWEASPVPDIDPDTVLSGLANSDEPQEKQDADGFLREILKNGEMPATTVFSEAEQNGISERTLKRAKKRLGVQSKRKGQPGTIEGAWYWSLPPKDSPKSARKEGMAPFKQKVRNSQETTTTSPKEATKPNMALFEDKNGPLRKRKEREPGDDTDFIEGDGIPKQEGVE